MGCAFLRLLSQPADYDMLVASATEHGIRAVLPSPLPLPPDPPPALSRSAIPRVPATVTPFARLMTPWHLALPRFSLPPSVSLRARLRRPCSRGRVAESGTLWTLASNSRELIATLDSKLASACVAERERAINPRWQGRRSRITVTRAKIRGRSGSRTLVDPPRYARGRRGEKRRMRRIHQVRL